MQAPSLDPAVLHHLPSGSTFCSASETLLEGIERLEPKTKADLWKPTVPLGSGTRLFWAQWPANYKPGSIEAHSVNIQQAKLLMDWVK